MNLPQAIMVIQTAIYHVWDMGYLVCRRCGAYNTGLQVQVQVFYLPNRSTCYNLQSVCSSFLEGGRTEKHSLTSCPPKYKNTNTWILLTIDISQSNIKWYWKQHEKEESESSLRLRLRTQKDTPHLALSEEPWGALWVLCREYIVRYRECTVLWAERRRSTVTPTMPSPSGSELAESGDKFGISAIARLHGSTKGWF